MATTSLRLPADVIDQLKQQARTRHVRYTTTYVRAILERAARGGSPPEWVEITERLDRFSAPWSDWLPHDDQKTASNPGTGTWLIEPAKRETYDNGVTEVIYRDERRSGLSWPGSRRRWRLRPAWATLGRDGHGGTVSAKRVACKGHHGKCVELTSACLQRRDRTGTSLRNA